VYCGGVEGESTAVRGEKKARKNQRSSNPARGWAQPLGQGGKDNHAPPISWKTKTVKLHSISMEELREVDVGPADAGS
jgi:hypothetical protein